MKSQLTNIILFSRPFDCQVAKSRLRKSDLTDSFVTSLHNAFLEDVIETLESFSKNQAIRLFLAYYPCSNCQETSIRKLDSLAGIEVFRQEGSSFGIRFDNAIARVRQESPGDLIILGSDCPLLGKPSLDLCLQALDKNLAALGPAQDGGFYLLALPAGATTTNFADGFESWPENLSVINKIVPEQIEILPFLFDIDTRNDLENLKNLIEISNVRESASQLSSSNECFLQKSLRESFPRNTANCLLRERPTSVDAEPRILWK